MGGVSPRKSFGGLFKAQKTKVSKSDRQKLRESLKIFDFSSDSGSGEEGEMGEGVSVKISIKPKPTPPVAKATTDVKREVKGESGEQKRQSKPNVR